ncbi:hypothetical protein SUGI_0848640 [Cryptomeria japonica]|nr:hypothetical protein SUGI_0848640 [Cryptomeria japonica]
MGIGKFIICTHSPQNSLIAEGMNLEAAAPLQNLRKPTQGSLREHQSECSISYHRQNSSARASTTNTAHCTTCIATTSFAYKPFLQCTIETVERSCRLYLAHYTLAGELSWPRRNTI